MWSLSFLFFRFLDSKLIDVDDDDVWPVDGTTNDELFLETFFSFVIELRFISTFVFDSNDNESFFDWINETFWIN